MASSPADVEVSYSSRRSISRVRVKITLQDHGGTMLLHELATACGMTTKRLKDVVYGNDDDFSVARAPFTLGLVAVHTTPLGEMMVLTPAGEEECARIRREPYWAFGRGRGLYG